MLGSHGPIASLILKQHGRIARVDLVAEPKPGIVSFKVDLEPLRIGVGRQSKLQNRRVATANTASLESGTARKRGIRRERNTFQVESHVLTTIPPL